MKKILKSFIFVLAGVLTLVGLASCGHSHKYTYESDNTKHREVCECGEKKEWEPHVWGDWTVTKQPTEDEKGSRKHTCTVCNKEVAEDIKQLDPELAVSTESKAVYAQVPADWEAVNIYYWNDEKTEGDTALAAGYAVGWPGVPMTSVDAASHLWGFEIPAGVECVIFNNGTVQTVDIKLAKSKNLYVLSEETNADGKFESTYSSYTKKATDPELAKPVFKEAGFIAPYVTVLEGWETVNLYWYGSAKECDKWPGVAMTAVEGATNVYTYDKLPDDATHVIFNNGTNQTVDIPVVKGLDGFIILEDVEVKDDVSKHLAKTGEYNLTDKKVDEVKLVDFYAQVPAEWTEVYIHFWEGAKGLQTKWPGAAMTVVDETNHIYKYTIDAKVTTIIIDAGNDVKDGDTVTEDKPQIPNTKINVEGVNAVIVTAAEDANGAQAKLAKYENETITEVVVEKVTPVFYVVGDIASLKSDTVAAWSFADNGKLTINSEETEATLTVVLAANEQFKVSCEGWDPEFNASKIELGTAFVAGDGGNIKTVTAGTYLFKITGLNTTPVLTITLQP